VLAIVCVGVFMNTLDTGIVDILNPVFVSQFHLTLDREYWIELAYAIPLIGMLLPAGHLGDRLGRKHVFLTGIILFGCGSGLLTLLPTFAAMLLARAIEGVGAALISANGGVLAVSMFPWNRRGQVLGIIGAAVALGLKAGPVVGGLLNDTFGWRSAFLVNVAIGLTFVILGANVIPASRRVPGRSFDVMGAALFVAGMGCLLLLLNQGPNWGWTSPTTVSLFIIFATLAALFFWVSLRVPDPTIDLRLYKIRNFSVAVAVAFMSFVALTAINQLLPFYMESVQGLHVSETGLVFITTTLAIAITQPFSGRLADKIGSRPVASAGLLVQGLGLASLAFIPLHMNPDWLVPQLAFIGFGVGLFRSPNHRALFGAVPRDKMGQAGGYQHLPRQLGESLGETSLITLFTAIVLAGAAAVGIRPVAPGAVPAAPVPTAAPTPATPANGQRIPLIQPYQPAPAPAPGDAPAPAATSASVGPVDAADDVIVDVPDDGEQANKSDLPEAVTTLPGEVQMQGYRIMWALGGLVALAGAAISWFLRDPEADGDH
jgi:EmrB/QacA subfamily drug resistance transporter